MITSSEGFLIATPTKCATTTLEAVARRHMRNAGIDADVFRIMDWDSPRRQHRMALPPMAEGHVYEDDPEQRDNAWGDVDRYLFVRNPYRRYMSIYTYLSAPANYSQWGARDIQGVDWGGHDESKVLHHPKMSFETFLFWLADKREEAAALNTRGDIEDGRAYRSPWVWTDSLSESAAYLRAQPGEAEGDVEFLPMESMWTCLKTLAQDYDLAGLDLSPIHANRSTGYGPSGAAPESHEFWGGIKCARKVWRGGTYNGAAVGDAVGAGCHCAACAVGVSAEALDVGYGW